MMGFLTHRDQALFGLNPIKGEYIRHDVPEVSIHICAL